MKIKAKSHCSVNNSVKRIEPQIDRLEENICKSRIRQSISLKYTKNSQNSQCKEIQLENEQMT